MPPSSTATTWDHVFGGWRELVRYVEDELESWLDTFDAGTSILDSVVSLLTVNPMLDLVGVDALMGFFEGVTDAGSQAIRAGMTNSLMDDLACSGFCIMYNADNKTFGDLILAAWEQQDHTIIDPAKWAMLECAERLLASSKAKYYNLGKNNPDPDWTILCDCASDTWQKSFTFAIDSGGWYLVDTPYGPPRGVYVEGTGFVSVTQAEDNLFAHQIHIQRDFSLSTITRVAVQGHYQAGEGAPEDAFRFMIFRQGVLLTEVAGYKPVNGAVQKEWTGVLEADRIGLNLVGGRVRGREPNPTGHGYFYTVTIEGTGTNPFT